MAPIQRPVKIDFSAVATPSRKAVKLLDSSALAAAAKDARLATLEADIRDLRLRLRAVESVIVSRGLATFGSR